VAEADVLPLNYSRSLFSIIYVIDGRLLANLLAILLRWMQEEGSPHGDQIQLPARTNLRAGLSSPLILDLRLIANSLNELTYISNTGG
jgi:hypothetical protein